MTSLPQGEGFMIRAEDPVGETARQLIEALCSEMSERYGRPPSPFSSSEAAKTKEVFLVARSAGRPVGCGALRRFEDETAEIKRMYVAPEGRRGGIGRKIIAELERHAVQFGYKRIVLETGIRQPEAQRMYESCAYKRIPAFGNYMGNPTSVCYEKMMPEL